MFYLFFEGTVRKLQEDVCLRKSCWWQGHSAWAKLYPFQVVKLQVVLRSASVTRSLHWGKSNFFFHGTSNSVGGYSRAHVLTFLSHAFLKLLPILCHSCAFTVIFP